MIVGVTAASTQGARVATEGMDTTHHRVQARGE
jgi:hypothetical protein